VFDWELRDPSFLVLLLLAPLVYWLASRSRSLLSYSTLSLVRGAGTTLRMRLAKLPAILLALATITLVVGLARPRTPQRETKVSREGIAIMMVVDLSSSMDARDLVQDDRAVNRLDVVKDVFLKFVNGGDRMTGRPDDLIGLVTFAGYADSVCPLTLDHGNLSNIVKDLSIVQIESEDGTAIGDGLGLAVERLRRSKAKSKIAILLTDGVTTAGVIEPLKAAELALDQEIKVYCIGAGTNGLAPVPGYDMFGRRRLVAQRVEIDEETLKQVADKTGGKYYRAENKDALAEIYNTIDQLERVQVSEVRFLQYAEHFPYFVLTGMGLIAAATLLGGSVFRKLP
jgi:Ca-activated chloride channel family protein